MTCTPWQWKVTNGSLSSSNPFPGNTDRSETTPPETPTLNVEDWDRLKRHWPPNTGNKPHSESDDQIMMGQINIPAGAATERGNSKYNKEPWHSDESSLRTERKRPYCKCWFESFATPWRSPTIPIQDHTKTWPTTDHLSRNTDLEYGGFRLLEQTLNQHWEDLRHK